mgnify:CR=1 FL=1
MKLKKITGFILGLVFLNETTNAYFEDIATTHPNFQAIQWLQKNDIVKGYTSNDTSLFKSTKAVTRAEALKMEETLALELRRKKYAVWFN